ncbi:MAG: lipopolysaccharide biosynthesis protein [Bacteriovorax sp.]
MKSSIQKNIYYSFIEKIYILLVQFAVSLLLTRFLPREEFGAMGVVAGAYAFIQFFNVAFESTILREYHKYSSSLDDVISQFVMINTWKSGLISVAGLLIGGSFYLVQGKIYFLYASLSFLFVMIMDIAVSPFVILASTVFDQKLVTRISLVRWTLNAFMLLGLYFFRSIKFVMMKDFILMAVTIIVWHYYLKKRLKVNISWRKIDWLFLKKGFVEYSLWVHLIGFVTNIVYRIDAFVLYYFVSLQVIGNYNIALTAANMANIVPSILAYQNSVALTHSQTQEEAKRITGKFLRLSIYIGLLTFGAYFFLGKIYLRLMTGEHNVDDIYFYLLNIVAGVLIVKTLIAPLVSYINIKGQVKDLFVKVKLPLLIIVLFNYVLFSNLWGARGAAFSNIINGIVWAILIFIELNRYQIKISDMGTLGEDFNQLKKYVKKNKT